MNKIIQHKLVLVLLILVGSTSCSTQKNTLVSRSYHELTSYYNVYFNGNEALKAGLLKVETQIEEDFTHTLPLYKESLPQVGDLVSSDMDRAIEKGTKLIKFHSITKPPKSKPGSRRTKKQIKNEYNCFVDDAYLLMGRAYLYKKDYFRAHATFSLIIRNYKDDPVKYTANIWLLRTLSESGRYAEASELISSLEKDKEFPEELEGELAIASADLCIRQNRFDDAISFLNIGIKKIRGNKRKTRYTYVLAQLYQDLKKPDLALKSYRQVVRRRPNYDMLFNARINSAKVLSGEGQTAELKKELNKMRRQKKNKRYLDQIYYALGSISQNEGKSTDAIRYYQQSVANSSDNIHQRALSCITLANIYFDQKEYIPSGLYFDSAMVVIDEHYPNYDNISRQYKSLNRLVNNLNTVAREDSLQKLAALSEIERNNLISKWIDKEKTRQQEASASNADGQFRSARMRGGYRQTGLGNENSSWYFYNPSTVAYGKKDFKRIWGDRTLEDNWRRSDKTESSGTGTDQEDGENLAQVAETKKEERLEDPTKPEYYLQDIPLTDSLMAASHQRIRDALFDAGTLFKNEYSAYLQSIGCFRGLENRYPDNLYTLSSYFNLWDLYQLTGNQDSANYYKSWIIDHYPESNYAKYLINPNYFIELEARKDSINRLFSQAFNAYKNRNFTLASQQSAQALSMAPDSLSKSKLEFIRMVSDSRLLPANRFSDSIDQYVNKYPKAETVALARQIQSLLKVQKFDNYQAMVSSGFINETIRNTELLEKPIGEVNEAETKWDKSNDLLHYFVIAYQANGNINVNRLKFDLANYNLDHYTTRDFEIETETLNNDIQLIVVRNLDNKENAMIYFMSIIRRPEVFKSLAGTEYVNFIVSNNNFRQLLSERSYTDYLAYFTKNYSTYTKGRFSEEELESPEELMARKAKEENELQEKGEYVVVETATDKVDQKQNKKEELYHLDYSKPHSLAILIKQKGFKTGLLMRGFIQYNTTSYRDKKLRATPGMVSNGTLFLINTFPNAYEARNYLIAIQDRKELFQPIGQLPYSVFVISGDNLTKLQESGQADEYEAFHLKNYVQKKPTAPIQEKESLTAPASNAQKTTSAQATSQTAASKPGSQEQVSKKDTVKQEAAPVQSAGSTTPQTTVTNTPPEKSVSETQASQLNVPSKQGEKDTVQAVPAVAGITAEPLDTKFMIEPESPHKVIFILPSAGFNPTLLVTYLKRFNASNPGCQNLMVESTPLSDKNLFVLVSQFNSQSSALSYLKSVQNDQRVLILVKAVSYNLIAISEKNLATLKEHKTTEDYLKFYNQNYK